MGSVSTDDPHCPECGEAIGMTAAYCIHCSADLTEEREQVDADNVEERNGTSRPSSTSQVPNPTKDTASDGSLLNPDGLLDNSLTVVVGIIGALVIGVIEWFVITSILLIFLSDISYILGIVASIVVWLIATVYLVRRRTVQEAISKAAYGIAIAIMTLPLVVVAWGTTNVLFDFIIIGVICGILAVIVGVVGFIAGRFVTE